MYNRYCSRYWETTRNKAGKAPALMNLEPSLRKIDNKLLNNK